ncbi:MAG: Ig-like domain-containing protein [Fimbriimonadaceae bacterium]
MTMTTNLTDGQAIAGTFQFEVRVQSEALVTNVEFYVGDDLRSTDSSTPYNFMLDTLEEKAR